MALFCVTYDLLKNKDYQILIDELQRLGAHKAALSVWFVELNNTADEVRDHLENYIDDDDRLIVVPFNKKPTFTKALAGTINWLKQRFS